MGLMINVFLFYQDIKLLGEFNQTYAFFIIFGQLFLFSLHENLVFNIPILKRETKDYLISIVIIVASLIILNNIFLNIINYLFLKIDLKELAKIILIISLGIPFFIINKSFLGYTNGKKEMVKYSFLNFLRPFFIFLLVLTIFYLNKFNIFFPNLHIGYSITFSEILLFFLIFLINVVNINKIYKSVFNLNVKKIKFYLKNNFNYNLKALPNSFFSYSLFRIDILILSFFVSPVKIGIYSFAAMFVEGIYQSSHVIRDFINPIISEKYQKKKLYMKLIIKSASQNLIITLFLSLVCLFAYPIITKYLGDFNEDGYLILKILLFGICVYSTASVFEQIFLMTNDPTKQSVFMSLANLINFLLNLILIFYLNLIGAALATMITYIFMTIYLYAFLFKNKKKYFGR